MRAIDYLAGHPSIVLPPLIASFVAALWITPAPAMPQEKYPHPGSPVDVARGYFWTGGNHGASDEDGGDSHARDWKIRRRNAAGEWVAKYADPANNPHCQNGEFGCDVFGEFIVYRVPLYSPVDGVVVSCWRNHPNAPGPNEPHPLRCCKGDCSMLNEKGNALSCDDHSGAIQCPAEFGCPITRSGNYMAILTDENDRILFAHLAPGTIPQHLCPFDDELMDDANVHACGGGDCGPFPLEAIIPEDERPQVRLGEFIGRVGSSGASSSPHTHIHRGPLSVNTAGILVKDGANQPYLIKSAWMRPSEEPEWTKLDGWELKKSDDNPQPLILPSPFLRKDTWTAGGIKDVALSGSVAAYIDDQNRLHVHSWKVDADGAIQAQSSATGIEVDMVASALAGSGRDAVTASRNVAGNFRLDYWSVSPNGTVSLQDHTTTGPIGFVDVTPYPTGTGVIVAVKAGNGNLKLISYETDAAGNFTRRGSADGVSIRAVAVSEIRTGRHQNQDPADAFKGVATAVKTESGILRVDSWRWDENSKALSAASTRKAGAVRGQIDISAVPLPGDRQMFVTAARTDKGMELRSWSVSTSGELDNRWTRRLGDAREITIYGVSDGRFVTSYRDANGNLRIKGWSLGPKGKIGRVGEIDAGRVSEASSSLLRRDGGQTRLILTAVRDNAGRLRLISYDSNL